MITICSPQLGLSPQSSLGGEVHDYQLIKQLCKLGIKIKILLPQGKKYQPNSNLEVEYLPIPFVYPPHLFNFFCLPYIFKKNSEGFNILRFHNPYFLGLSALIFKKIFPNIKIVTTIHLKEERKDLLFILKKTVFVYDHIFTVSDYLRNWIIKEYNISPNKVSTIYNGVDPIIKPQLKDKKLIKKYNLKNKLILLNLGLIDDRKNVLFLLDLFEKLCKKYPDLVLMFCGIGPQKNDLQKKIKEKNMESNILILSNVYGDEKNKIFNLCDIFLFPSKNEGFGLVAAEAMMCGKPVIGSNNTSIPEVIKPETGFIAKTNDINDWVKKTEVLLQNKQLRLKIGKNANRYAKKEFNWQKVANKTIAVYKKLMIAN